MDLFALEKRMFFTVSMSGKSCYKGNNDRLFSMSLAARRKHELAVFILDIESFTFFLNFCAKLW